MQPGDLTDEQQKVYAENEAPLSDLETQLRSFQDAATSRLATVGLRFDPDATYCYQCPCGEFRGSDNQCDRATCHHSRLRHNGFT